MLASCHVQCYCWTGKFHCFGKTTNIRPVAMSLFQPASDPMLSFSKLLHGLQKILIHTRKHSSRMCTVHFSSSGGSAKPPWMQTPCRQTPPGCRPPVGRHTPPRCSPPPVMWPMMQAGKPTFPPLVDRMTDTYKTLPCPKLRLREVKISTEQNRYRWFWFVICNVLSFYTTFTEEGADPTWRPMRWWKKSCKVDFSSFPCPVGFSNNFVSSLQRITCIVGQ